MKYFVYLFLEGLLFQVVVVCDVVLSLPFNGACLLRKFSQERVRSLIWPQWGFPFFVIDLNLLLLVHDSKSCCNFIKNVLSIFILIKIGIDFIVNTKSSLSIRVWDLVGLKSRLLCKDVGSENDSLRVRPQEGSGCSGRSLLLLLLSLLVLLLLVWSGFSVIVSEVDLVCELDAEGASLDPRGLWLKWHSFGSELLKHRVFNTGDHVGRFDEGEGETRLHVQSLCIAWEAEFEACQTITQPLLLWKDSQMYILTLFKKLGSVFRIVFVCSFEIFLALLLIALHLLVYKSSYQPQLTRILLWDSVKHVVQLSKSFLIVLHQKQAEHRVERVLMNVE